MNYLCRPYIISAKQQQLLLLASGILFVIVTGVLYADSFQWLGHIWLNEKEYSHGFLVPLVSGYFIYLHRRQFAQCAIKPSLLPGLFFIVIAVLLLFAGRLGLVIQLEVLSFFVFLPGTIILLFGWDFLLFLLVPLGYLVFMLPVMDYIPGDLHLPLQYLAAAGGTKLIHLAGYAVYHEGLLLHLPDMTIKVARACSGVNLLFSVLAVGVPLVYLYQRSVSKALLVLAGGVLIAVAANSARVALAGISAIHYGVDMLHGPNHVLQAFSVAVVGYIALFFTSYLVNKYSSGKGPFLYEQVAEKMHSLAGQQAQPGGSFFPALVLLLVILSAVALCLGIFFKPQAVPLRDPLSRLPAGIGQWTSSTQTKGPGGSFFPNAPFRLQQRYFGEDSSRIDCFVGYFPKQDFRDHLFTYHSAELRSRLTPVALKVSCNGDNPQQVNHGFVTLDDGRRVEAVMWYRVAGKSETQPHSVRLAYAESTLLSRQNDVAVILCIRQADMIDTNHAISREFTTFISLFTCALQNYLP